MRRCVLPTWEIVLAGFGAVPLLPGIWPSLRLDTAVTLPVGLGCYAAYALRAWLADGHAISDRTRRFARWSATCSLALGMAGQVAFHLMDQVLADLADAPSLVIALDGKTVRGARGQGREGPAPAGGDDHRRTGRDRAEGHRRQDERDHPGQAPARRH